MITPQLTKAARALLGWQQSELAIASDLSLTAINNFERGVGTTRSVTRLAIQNSLEENGIEFLSGGGLRKVDEIATVSRFSGNDFIARWSEDIYAAVRKPREQILTASTSEAMWYQPAILQINDEYLAWAGRLDLTLKSLVPDDQKTLYKSRRNYRVIAPELIGKITYCLYADRIAFVLWKKKQVICLRNSLVADTFRNQFSYLWKRAVPFK